MTNLSGFGLLSSTSACYCFVSQEVYPCKVYNPLAFSALFHSFMQDQTFDLGLLTFWLPFFIWERTKEYVHSSKHLFKVLAKVFDVDRVVWKEHLCKGYIIKSRIICYFVTSDSCSILSNSNDDDSVIKQRQNFHRTWSNIFMYLIVMNKYSSDIKKQKTFFTNYEYVCTFKIRSQWMALVRFWLRADLRMWHS